MAINVEVARAHDLPTGHTDRPHIAQPVPAEEHIPLRAAHIPDGDLTGRVVLPHEIRMAVRVEIRGAYDRPSSHAGSARIHQGAHTKEDVSLRAAHVPDVDLPRRVVLPHEIGMAISIEVAAGHQSPSRHARRPEVAQVVPTQQEIPL